MVYKLYRYVIFCSRESWSQLVLELPVAVVEWVSRVTSLELFILLVAGLTLIFGVLLRVGRSTVAGDAAEDLPIHVRISARVSLNVPIFNSALATSIRVRCQTHCLTSQSHLITRQDIVISYHPLPTVVVIVQVSLSHKVLSKSIGSEAILRARHFTALTPNWQLTASP